MTPREENKTMMEDFASISVHLIFAGLPSVKASDSVFLLLLVPFVPIG
jgi:hypothetical protein